MFINDKDHTTNYHNHLHYSIHGQQIISISTYDISHQGKPMMRMWYIDQLNLLLLAWWLCVFCLFS